MKTFEEYIEQLARLHPLIRHEIDGYCHYSCLADDAQTRFAQRMRYPCVVVDTGDFTFGGGTGNLMVSTDYTILFLDHVRDTGNDKELLKVFSETRSILLDFAKKFSTDKRARKYPFLNRFDLIGSEGHRVYLKDAGLYGYALFLNNSESFIDKDCNNVWEE